MATTSARRKLTGSQQQGPAGPTTQSGQTPLREVQGGHPERPLHVLEMDIKSKWITRDRRNGYILTILDTFTRQVLHWQAGLCMTQHQITSHGTR
ncbi:MAG: hypothetical protein IPI72_10600 [Flavobacteriales bacterium]|nr:hypothetical protein [Flavobacteriales bacterium]